MQAIQHAELACQLEPEHVAYRSHLLQLQAKSYVRRAEALIESGDPHSLQSAVQTLQEAIEKDPLCTKAYLILGAVYAELNQFNRAIKTLKEVLKQNPQEETALQQMQQYQDKLNEWLQINGRRDREH